MSRAIPVIKLRNIWKVFHHAEEDTVALHGVNLTIWQGEFIAIMGPSGSGKSTLMYILGLLDMPTSGLYCLDGSDVSRITSNKQAAVRNQRIGFVFQQFNLLPRTTVLDNILLPTLYGDTQNPKQRAKILLSEIGLANREKYRTNQLSGGQQQRVAIARALINNPSVILADEPTGNLDSKRSRQIMSLFSKINEEGATVIVITHEESIAGFAKRVIRLQDGKIVGDTSNLKSQNAKL